MTSSTNNRASIQLKGGGVTFSPSQRFLSDANVDESAKIFSTTTGSSHLKLYTHQRLQKSDQYVRTVLKLNSHKSNLQQEQSERNYKGVTSAINFSQTEPETQRQPPKLIPVSVPGYKYEVPLDRMVYKTYKKEVASTKIKQALEHTGAKKGKEDEKKKEKEAEEKAKWAPSTNYSTRPHKDLAKSIPQKTALPSKKYSEVKSKVVTDRGMSQTAYGYPSVMLTDAATRQKIRARAGCPGEKVTGCMGTQIEHTQVMENEIYVNQKNPLQNSIKTYMLEMKSKTNQFKSQMNKELKPVSEKSKELWKKGMEQFDDDSKAAQRRAIVEDNNLSDYLIGKRKKYGDIQEQLGPQRYIDKVKNEKWLRSREKLSNDLQQARLKYRNDVRLSKTQGAELPKKLNEKELQKEQYNIAIDLFQVWDQDGGGELSQEELMTAFIRVGLSQDHHFAKRIMQSVRDEDVSSTDIVMKDFIKLFKKDDLCERIIT